ncbi:hypothetical protein ACJMK2_041824 [Sinanodonta woodiana]|uniref:Protein kinase domain-containing protein n=1 Tax=Sinanodonta woodiana TaxID=1069815 RepID=A0ABD3W5G4_SINWO
MGGKYLPIGYGPETKTVCEIRYRTNRWAKLVFKSISSLNQQLGISGEHEENLSCEILELSEDASDISWNNLREVIRTASRDYNGIQRHVEKVELYWPLEFIKHLEESAMKRSYNEETAEEHCNSTIFPVVLIDCPGITEDESSFESVLENSKTCHGFVFVVNISSAYGLERNKMLKLLEKVSDTVARRGTELNQDSADDQKKEMERQVLVKLRQVWSIVRPENTYHTKVKLTAHAIVDLGKKWPEAFVHKKDLKNKLDTYNSKLLKANEDVITNKENENNARMKTAEQFQNQLKQNRDLLQRIEFKESDVPDIAIEKNRSWSQRIKAIDLVICKMLAPSLADMQYVTNLSKKHQDNIRIMYKGVTSVLDSFQSQLEAFTGSKSDSVELANHFGIFGPFLTALAIRTLPRIVPFALLAASLAPLPLVIMSFVEEYQEYKDEKESQKFHSYLEKRMYLKDRTEYILNKLTDCTIETLTNSQLFIFFFGEAEHKKLLCQIEVLLECINELNRVDLEQNFETRQLLKAIILHTLEAYAKDNIYCDMDQKDIQFVRDRKSDRIEIESGQHRTFEGILNTADEEMMVAIKEITCIRPDLSSDKSGSDLPQNLDIYREPSFLRQLSRKGNECQNFIKFYGSCFIVSENMYKLCLVMERCLLSLKNVIYKQMTLSKRSMFIKFALDAASGLKFLHDNGILHRNVKPSNFLVSKTDNTVICDERHMIVKISDVGISRYSDQQVTESHTQYKAPEIITSNRPGFHSQASDIYSLGLVIWELWYCDRVYEKFSTDRGEIPKLKPRDPTNKMLRSLIDNCLQSNPNKRLSITEVVAIAMKITAEQNACPLE